MIKIEHVKDERTTPTTVYQSRVLVGRARLHVFHRGDVDPYPHDHAWPFWTFPLVGYLEEVHEPDGRVLVRQVLPFQVHYRPAEYRHRVLGPLSGKGKIVTLVWRGAKSRQWGFWIDGEHVPGNVYVENSPPLPAPWP